MRRQQSNHEWIDQFRQHQKARRASHLEALEKMMTETLKGDVEIQCHSCPPTSRHDRWLNLVSQWFVEHSWVAQQFQKQKDKATRAGDSAAEAVIEVEFEVIKIVEEK